MNVWTNAANANARRPVMMWIYGGGFTGGSGGQAWYDGEDLANKGAVIVTMNYRLGQFGFLAHPELAKEAGHTGSGNYGVMDALAALQWIKRNIAAFGGDPQRVTIFGQSAGSSAVSQLMASPLAKGLFHRAIGQSGGGFFGRILGPLDAAEKVDDIAVGAAAEAVEGPGCGVDRERGLVIFMERTEPGPVAAGQLECDIAPDHVGDPDASGTRPIIGP